MQFVDDLVSNWVNLNVEEKDAELVNILNISTNLSSYLSEKNEFYEKWNIVSKHQRYIKCMESKEIYFIYYKIDKIGPD